jgi:hypothetical protein
MANITTGSNVKGGEDVNILEDARWPLVEALKTAAACRAALRRAEACLDRMERLLAESQSALVRAEQARGATHFRPEAVRTDGLTVTLRRPSGPDIAIASALVDSVRDDNPRPLADALQRLEPYVRLQEVKNGGSNGSNGHDANA